MNICIDTDSIVTDSSRASSSTSTSDTLEKYGQWLLMIPRDDVSMLQNTQAYSTFLQAFDDLKRAHQQLATRELLKNSVAENDDHHRFLQHFAAEDIILRIFEYLEVCALVRIMMTCHRFHSLGEKSAEQRSQDFANPRMLSSKIKVLRAQEQHLGINSNSTPFVRVPILGLCKRVFVSGAGDPEYNGIYFCTGSNGNGFLFSKPRFPRLHQSELTSPVKPLLCMIAKRFSGSKILWYMSKEIVASGNHPTDTERAVLEIFSFWANMMHVGEVTPDLNRYPSQTSALLSEGGDIAWQPLASTIHFEPPIVEVMTD